MQPLFSPFTLKGIYLKNRIVMPGLASFLIDDDGCISDATIEHYRRRAAGGPAMVIMEACAVSPEGVVSNHQARIDDDRFIEGLHKIAVVMKSEGSVPAVQIHHSGRQTSIKVIKRKPLAPSAIPCPTIRGEVEPLTTEGIHDIVQKFGDAAQRSVQAGFELVEIHGAHGYLINQFLSRVSNAREDEYGGDIVGRSRFAIEIVETIRQRLGAHFPLSFKISAQEFLPDGLTVAESIEILKLLVKAGIDGVQVSAGNDITAEWICQPMFMEQACLAESAARIKKALNIPVMAVGRINDPLVANAVLEKNQADLVCIGRGLLADPQLPNKAREGRLDEIRTCIACNTCMESIFRKGRIECLVNPTLGREKEMAFVPASKPKRVMVVGGGPGGLNVAWVAARRGHKVHVFEKRGALGGQLLSGSVPGHKKDLLSLIRFQEKQIEKFGVTCHLNHAVQATDIQEFNPDVVVLATGSQPALPPVDGINNAIVMTYEDVLNGAPPSFRQAVVIGGGATGLELALYLAENDCHVSVVEMLAKIGRGLESMTKKILLGRLKEHRVSIWNETQLVRIESKGAVVSTGDKREMLIEAEKVILATGNRPQNDLYQKVNSLGYETHLIGDCLETRSAKEAIYESAVLGRKI
ncbi:MAG: FAD-dependent oxidoreductase [Deltaproteobacteria bacterium]|jgi:2,4-dienoyl-CoA reductase-like NADH-dependent reductase (Old Yellow Enzyme family)/thioredoxin reductase|nr:FAD-dependent oxidoreductase [Deltaproteobacteria bacterium]